MRYVACVREVRNIYKNSRRQSGGEGGGRGEHLGLECTNFLKLKAPPENSARQNGEGK
jgi:hypothetical protein